MSIDGVHAGPAASRAAARGGVPWQILVVVALLGLEGLGNLLSIPSNPQAAVWLGWKVLMIVGLIQGWRAVFVLHLVMAGLHVIGFAPHAPVVAALNFATMLLVVFAYRHFFSAR